MADAPPQPQSIAEWEAQVLEAQRQRKRRLAQSSESQEKEPANITDRMLESENRASENGEMKHKSTQKDDHP